MAGAPLRITEFVDQGEPKGEETPSVKPGKAIQLASQGCAAITMFLDKGFVPRAETKNDTDPMPPNPDDLTK